MGLLALIAGHLISESNREKLWVAVYPPPQKILLETMPFLFWFVGGVLIVVVLVKLFEKKDKQKK